MRRILFLSGLYPKASESVFKAKSRSNSIQNAPNVFQWAVLSGLYENNIDFITYSYPFLSSFPLRYRQLKVDGYPILLNNIEVGRSFPYFNLMYFKGISIKRSISKEVENWLMEKPDSDSVVLVYSPLSYMIEPLIELKQKYTFKICVIVTDLIQDASNFSVNNNFFKRLQIASEMRKEYSFFPLIDKYVLLSSHMLERIPEAKDRSIIVEGIARFKDEKVVTKREEDGLRILLYSGSLHGFSGIEELVLAFMKTTNDKFRLYICGIGDKEFFIKEKQAIDRRIIFLGNVSREEAIKYQREADVVINPRRPNGGITKYSFPSKTMEYLSSGTPMIGYRLEGIPEDYFKYIVSPEDMSLNALSSTIERTLMLSDEELSSLGNKALLFIREQKTSKHQVARIINFVFDE